MKKGDLVQTEEGYYGIVLNVASEDVCEVFLGNGLRSIEKPATLQVMSLPFSPSPANFIEIVEKFEGYRC